ncbi:MAG: DUF4276 family protein [Chloroflexi bacterium]|nr:DUF4276 family protein [Chloroflexota bacterium]
MNRVRIVAIVEGQGEVEAVPLLIRRVAQSVDPSLVPDIPTPIRVAADRFKKPGELERTVELAVRKLGGEGGVLILIDCDWNDGCPKMDAPPLIERARLVRPNVPISLVLAYREYEAWFIAAAESIRGKHRLPGDLETVADPEAIRGAKEWLSRRMPPRRPYAETIDQPGLTGVFDIQAARRAGSFDKCYREIVGLLTQLKAEDR